MTRIEKLKAELALPKYSGMTDDQILASLTTKDVSKLRVLNAHDLNAWGAGNARHIKFRKAKDGIAPFDGLTDEQMAIAVAAWRMVDRDDTELDCENAEHIGLVDAMIAAGVLTAQDKADLITRATTLQSRADEIGVERVRLGTIQQTRANK